MCVSTLKVNIYPPGIIVLPNSPPTVLYYINLWLHFTVTDTKLGFCRVPCYSKPSSKKNKNKEAFQQMCSFCFYRSLVALHTHSLSSESSMLAEQQQLYFIICVHAGCIQVQYRALVNRVLVRVKPKHTFYCSYIRK